MRDHVESRSARDEGAPGADSARPPTWQAPGYLGAAAALQAVTTVAAPLLAGFSLTLSVAVVTASQNVRWPGVALMASVVATVFLVSAVQFGAWARQHSVTPDDYRTWFDDTVEQREYYVNEMGDQERLYNKYAGLARTAYLSGIVMILVALGIVVSPPEGAAQQSARWMRPRSRGPQHWVKSAGGSSRSSLPGGIALPKRHNSKSTRRAP